jgi:hypothetical protein
MRGADDRRGAGAACGQPSRRPGTARCRRGKEDGGLADGARTAPWSLSRAAARRPCRPSRRRSGAGEGSWSRRDRGSPAAQAVPLGRQPAKDFRRAGAARHRAPGPVLVEDLLGHGSSSCRGRLRKSHAARSDRKNIALSGKNWPGLRVVYGTIRGARCATNDAILNARRVRWGWCSSGTKVVESGMQDNPRCCPIRKAKRSRRRRSESSGLQAPR